MMKSGMKIALKRAVTQPLSACGAFSLTRRLLKGKVVILAYHRVVDDDVNNYEPGMAVSADTFAKHMDWLNSRFHVMDLLDYAHGFGKGEAPKSPCAIVTFDDGWLDNYQVAFPIMKSAGVAATIFIASDYFGTGRVYWNGRVEEAVRGIDRRRETLVKSFSAEHMPSEASFVKDVLADEAPLGAMMSRIIAEMKYKSPEVIEKVTAFLEEIGEIEVSPRRVLMNWDEVREMHNAGFKFGSHSASHTIMTTQNASDCAREACESMRKITEKLGTRPESFAFPNGDHNEVVIREIRRAGYTCAVTVAPGFANLSHDLFTLPRFTIHEGGAPSSFHLDYLLSGLAGS
jgi:peptidoglycan/xylan/chitin deacetylase (PgdA/CDA1 family)